MKKLGGESFFSFLDQNQLPLTFFFFFSLSFAAAQGSLLLPLSFL